MSPSPDTPQGSPAIPREAVPDDHALAHQFRERLRLFALRRLGDAAAAEDVAQEVLRRVSLALRESRVENPAALPGFVFQTALHVCLQHHRSAGREARALSRFASDPSLAPVAVDPLAALIGGERRERVRRALDRLDRPDRLLLRMLYYELVEARDAAQRLGVTVEALRVRKHRALKRLGALLGDAVE